MFLFLSFLTTLFSLYYLGVMVNSYNADTTYSAPVIALLLISLINIIREFKRIGFSTWLFGDDDDFYTTYSNQRRDTTSYSNSASSYHTKSSDYNFGSYNYNSKPTEKVEYFTQDKKVEKDDEKLLSHYPSQKEVRDKIKELEKSPWFRMKRSAASVVGVDITEKYYKPTKVKSNEKIKPIEDKESDERFMPPMVKREREEYNIVAKQIGRCCEISFNTEIEQTEENG